MPSTAISIAIPTLNGGPLLHACLSALERQEERDFEVVVIDNSAAGLSIPSSPLNIRTIHAGRNLGFAKAVNQAWSGAPHAHLAVLNDDTEARPGWLRALRQALESAPDVGMCASQVLLYGTDRLDSAGMQIFRDGSSKQRGHSRAASKYLAPAEVLFPSASAALYRREMIHDIGMFDEDLFLYCEDTDLGLRARWNGWRCLYVPDAVVEHHYSRSSGAVSPLKVWHIERNRLWVAAKNFPSAWLFAVPFFGAVRYAWHLIFLLQKRGSAARFQDGANHPLALAGIILKAHWSLLTSASALRRKRRAIRKNALLTDRQFSRLLTGHLISAREIASL